MSYRVHVLKTCTQLSRLPQQSVSPICQAALKGTSAHGWYVAAACCVIQAAYGGANCSAEQGEMRLVTPCTNSTPCPRDCVGNWSISGGCSGACGGGNGTLPETYAVTTTARWGGAPCPFANGATRSILNCTNDSPCPVPCNYTWIQNGNCTGVSPGLRVH